MNENTTEQKFFKIGEIMKLFKASRRCIEYHIETLGLEPRMWRSGMRLFDEKQIEEIRNKINATTKNIFN